MTYRKINITESVNPVEASLDSDETVHRPEIVISRNKYTIPETQQRKGIFRISLIKTVIVAMLCSASFAVGCTVTNEKMAEYMDSVASVTSGKSKNGKQTEELAESVTFYEKYMSDDLAVDKTRIEFLSTETIIPENENPLPEETPVSVTGPSYGSTYADGEQVFQVIAQDMSASDVHVLSNQTKYKPDTVKLMSQTPKVLENITINPSEPLVLVLHTHGTESYNMGGNENFVSATDSARSNNTDENVVSVGRKMVSVLNDFGIPSVHSEKMCDSESFVNAYSESYAEAKYYLEKYPSIRFVIDLHRDAIELSDGTRKKPVYESYGKKSAQLMFVVGTNEAGAKHPDWEENLSLALVLQNEIGKDNPQLFRGINLRTASFNQQLSPGYLLLECGSAANTIEEAESAAEAFATGFARVIIKSAS